MVAVWVKRSSYYNKQAYASAVWWANLGREFIARLRYNPLTR